MGKRGYKKTITLGLDYSEFSGGITECNAKMKNLDAEFALMQEKMDGTASASEQLAVKQEYLTEKINLQQVRVAEAKKKYDALLESHASTTKIDKAATALAKEELQLVRLEDQLEDTQLAQSNFKESATALVAVVGTISAALLKAAKDTAAYADEVLTLSAQTSIATDTLQGWMYASELVDVSTEAMTSSIQKMERNMQQASKGSGDAYEAFKKLGVEITTASGEMRSAEDVFNDTIDALGGIANATEQDQLAMNIFGRSAADLTGVITAGSAGMEAYKNKAEELGRIMSQDDLEAAGELDDAMQELNSAFEALERTAGSAVLPVLTAFFNLIASIPTPVLMVLTTLGSVVAVVVTLVKTIDSAMSAGSAIAKVFSKMNGVFDSTYVKIFAIVTVITVLVLAITTLVGKSRDLNNSLASVGNMTNSISTGKTPQVGHNAGGTKNWRGGLTYINENGAELVELPTGTKIYNSSETKQMLGTTNNYFSLNVDLVSLKTIGDVVAAVEGLKTSAECGG